MAQLQLTTKKSMINKAQATIVMIVAGAVFVTIFSLLSAKSLWAIRGYQARVIDKKTKAYNTLKKNNDSVKDLVNSYQEFVSTSSNMLEGNPAGTGEKDGDNARLVLDALPSKYDFPALTASLEKVVNDNKLKIDSITGTDDEVAQSTAKVDGNPQPGEIPFQLAVKGSYQSVQDLVNVLERSIRPFEVQKLTLSGGMEDMKAEFEAKSYFQPERTLNIRNEVVK